MKKIRLISMTFLSIFIFSQAVYAAQDTIKVALTSIPGFSDTKDKILYRYIAELLSYTDYKIEIDIVPKQRSITGLLKGKYDIQFFNGVAETEKAPSDHDYSTATFWQSNLVLYSNINNKNSQPISERDIYARVGDVRYFDFEVTPSSNAEGTMKMVAMNRLDGFIVVDKMGDRIARKLKLDNVKRERFKLLSAKAILPKGGRGGELDKALLQSLKEMTEDGSIQKYREKFSSTYDPWQPYMVYRK